MLLSVLLLAYACRIASFSTRTLGVSFVGCSLCPTERSTPRYWTVPLLRTFSMDSMRTIEIQTHRSYCNFFIDLVLNMCAFQMLLRAIPCKVASALLLTIHPGLTSLPKSKMMGFAEYTGTSASCAEEGRLQKKRHSKWNTCPTDPWHGTPEISIRIAQVAGNIPRILQSILGPKSFADRKVLLISYFFILKFLTPSLKNITNWYFLCPRI